MHRLRVDAPPAPVGPREGRQLLDGARVAPKGYNAALGACKTGFEDAALRRNAAALAARSVDACAAACTALGTSCVSAAWYASGITTFRQVRSQCWLSATCTVPDCCAPPVNAQRTRRAAAVQPWVAMAF